MALTSSITRPVFTGLFGAVEGGGGGGVTRNFIRLNISLSQYFTFQTQEATGDFEYQFDFFSTDFDKSSTSVMLGNDSSNISGVRGTLYGQENKIRFRTDTQNLESTAGRPSILKNVLHTVNVKQVGSVLIVKVDGVTAITPGSTVNPLLNRIGLGWVFVNGGSGFDFNGYIKDVHLISGFPQNKLFKLDETLIGSNAIVDSNGGSAGAMINGGSAYSEPFTLNTNTTPNVWVNNDASISIPVANVEGENGYYRNIIKLNRSLTQYFTFNEQEATSNFEYQFDFFSTDFDSNTDSVMLGNNRTDSDDIRGTLYGKSSQVVIRTNTQNLGSPVGNPTISQNIFHTVNVKKVGSTFVVKVDGATVITSNSVLNPILSKIGSGWRVNPYFFYFNGYIKDVHLISGFPQNNFFKLNETLVGSNAIVDYNGGTAGSMVNGGAAYSERFTLNTAVSPNVWVNNDGSISLPIAGT